MSDVVEVLSQSWSSMVGIAPDEPSISKDGKPCLAWEHFTAEMADLLTALASHGLTIEQGWSSDMEAARDAGIVDLWAKERDRYEHDRIPDCLYHDGTWVHEQTIHDDDSMTDEGGFVEVFEPTHWRRRPSPPEETT